jgi:peptidoglycan/xylan/chitin deacetylase (PgdA/CDA1 family)
MVWVSDGTAPATACFTISDQLTIPLPIPTDPTLTITPAEPSPLLPATITAHAASERPLEYAFAVRVNDGQHTTWQVLQPFSTAAQCSWTPAEAGSYTLMALTRAAATPDGPGITITQNCTVAVPPALGVAQYHGDTSAAVSYTFDDGMICQTDVIAPLFAEFGFHATFYINTVWMLENNDFTDPWKPGDWAGWRRVISAGHEVGNHSISHPDLTTLDSAALQQEVNGNADIITQHLGVAPLTFAYPYNSWNEQVKQVVSQRHIWARERMIPLEEESFTLAFANSLVDTAITEHTWIVPFGHGVDGAGWSPISSSILRSHLIYVKARSDANAIWVDTAANVARYVQERDTAQLQLQSSAAGIRTFTVQCPGLDPAIYTVPLTVKVSTGTVTATTATATRGATNLPIVAIRPGWILVDVVPGPDAVIVTYQ